MKRSIGAPLAITPDRMVAREPRREGRSLAWLVYALGVTAYAALFAVWQIDPMPAEIHILGVLLGALCSWPIVLWYTRGRQDLPVFELICLSYGVQFSLPLYLQYNRVYIRNQYVPLPWHSVLSALIATLLGVAMLQVGYYVARRYLASSRIGRIDLPLTTEGRSRYIVAGLIVSLGAWLFTALGLAPSGSGPLGAILRLISYQLYIVIAILTYQVYRGSGRKPGLVVALYGIVAIAALLGLTSGLLEDTFIPVVILFVVRWHATRKFPRLFLLLLVVAFLLLNPLKQAYRAEAWYGTAALGVGDRLSLWFELGMASITSIGNGDGGLVFGNSLDRAMARFDLLHKFAYVQELTPTYVPYYRGETYGYLLYGWIPRFVWPDKPVASDVVSMLDVDYELLYDFQTRTTKIGIGQLPEAFANFGLVGIVLVMSLQGLFFAMLDRILNGPKSDGGRAIYLSLMIFCLNGIGSATVVIFGALVQSVVANALILRVFASGFQADDGHAPAAPPPPGGTPRPGAGPMAPRGMKRAL